AFCQTLHVWPDLNLHFAIHRAALRLARTVLSVTVTTGRNLDVHSVPSSAALQLDVPCRSSWFASPARTSARWAAPVECTGRPGNWTVFARECSGTLRGLPR